MIEERNVIDFNEGAIIDSDCLLNKGATIFISNVSLKDEKYGLVERNGGEDYLSSFRMDLSVKEEGIKITSILSSKEFKIVDKPKDIKKVVDFFNPIYY